MADREIPSTDTVGGDLVAGGTERVHVHAPFWWSLMPAGAVAAGVGSVLAAAYSRDTIAGLCMLAAALFIVFFARERMTLFALVIPACIIAFMSGSFAMPALVLGCVAAIGIGAFLFRINRAAFLLAAAASAAIGFAFGSAPGILFGVAFIPAAIVLSMAYPRTTVGEAVGVTALTAALSAVVFGVLFVIASPNISKDGLAGVADIGRLLLDRIADYTAAAYAEAGVEVGAGAVRQYALSLVRMLPGVAAAVAEIAAFLAVAVCGAIFRTLDIEPHAFTEAPSRYLLSPICGAVYFAAIIVYLSLTGGDGSVGGGTAAVICENIILMLALPLTVFSVSWLRRVSLRGGWRFIAPMIIIAPVISVMTSGFGGLSLFAAFGCILCIILPIADVLASRRKQ